MEDNSNQGFSLQHFKNNAELVENLVAELNDVIHAIRTNQAEFILAVSGGSSPIPLFEALAKQQTIDWSKGVVTLIDERYVPLSDENSNERLVKQHLLQANAASARFASLYDANLSVDERVKTLNQDQSRGPIDIGVLGMGMDGHTASLFPCSPEFAENLATQSSYVVATPGTAPYKRISLSAAALLAIRHLYLFIPGQEKLERFQRIASGSDNISPLYYLLKRRKHPMRVFSCA